MLLGFRAFREITGSGRSKPVAKQGHASGAVGIQIQGGSNYSLSQRENFKLSWLPYLVILTNWSFLFLAGWRTEISSNASGMRQPLLKLCAFLGAQLRWLQMPLKSFSAFPLPQSKGSISSRFCNPTWTPHSSGVVEYCLRDLLLHSRLASWLHLCLLW